MFDRTKSKKKKTNSTNDRLFAEISIPLSSSFLNETIEQKDLPINPRHPDSTVRLKVKKKAKAENSFSHSARRLTLAHLEEKNSGDKYFSFCFAIVLLLLKSFLIKKKNSF